MNFLRRIRLKLKNEKLYDDYYQTCEFCKKPIKSLEEHNISVSLEDKSLYCTFCIRNRFNNKDSKNVLIISFRGIIGYLYHLKYATKNRKIHLSQLKDMIYCHMSVGLKNPVFNYDPETYLWYIDFNRIGRGRKKLDFDLVHAHLDKILKCFDLSSEHHEMVFEKFEKSLIQFYEKRQRPKNKKMLIPTMKGIVNLPKNRSSDAFRLFLPKNLVLY